MYLKTKKENFLDEPVSGFWLGPTTADLGGGEILLCADCMEKSDGVKFSALRRSYDSGESWNKQGEFEHCATYEGGMRRDGYGALYKNPKSERIFYFGNELYWDNDKLDSTWRCRKLYYRISEDRGHSWSDKRHIVQSGSDEFGAFDDDHYMKGVTFGQNMAGIYSQPVRLSDGSIVLGVQRQVPEGAVNAGPTGMGFLEAGALKGRWDEKAVRFHWEFGDWVGLPFEITTRGLYEPALAELPDGRVLMVCRGSNYKREDDLVGCKFYCVSKDGGLHWNEPKPLYYDTGEIMFASSCSPRLLSHSGGELYFIGVINTQNPRGNLPRYPLCAAEIDQTTLTVKKNSVFVIDTKPDDLDDTQGFPVDFSNHWSYEDEHTGDLIVMAPFRPELDRFDGHLNTYRIGMA